MPFRYISIFMLTLLLGAKDLQAESVCHQSPCDRGFCKEMDHSDLSCCGVAYEESIFTPKLVVTILTGAAVVALIAVALVNTPNNHSHDSHSSY